jgi:hypothetical protein
MSAVRRLRFRAGHTNICSMPNPDLTAELSELHALGPEQQQPLHRRGPTPTRSGLGSFHLFPSLLRVVRIAIALVIMAFPRPLFAADGIAALLRRTHWGESSDELLQEFGSDTMRSPRPIDFGDSYVDVVLRGQSLGGVPMVVFFQMDKATHGLKRIQLERPRHNGSPPNFRAIGASLRADYGEPDQSCAIPELPDGGYQAAEERWVHGEEVISVIFRDTTLQAFEGCLFGPAYGGCGLHGQLLVRIGKAADDPDPCFLASRHDIPGRRR